MARSHRVRIHQRQASQQREALEKRYRSQLNWQRDSAYLISGEKVEEAYHRLHPYRQAYHPELARQFLEQGFQAEDMVADPFSGSGTLSIEARKQGVGVLALELMASLCLSLRGMSFSMPSEASATLSDDWQELASQAQHPFEKATVLLASARTVRGDGRPRPLAMPVSNLVHEVRLMIHDDQSQQALSPAMILQSDAQHVPLKDSSLAGVLTSPPFLSRYDYLKVLAPMEKLLSSFGWPHLQLVKQKQVKAHPKANTKGLDQSLLKAALDDYPMGHPIAVLIELSHALSDPRHQVLKSHRKSIQNFYPGQAAMKIAHYFQEMSQVMRELQRVLKDGAPLWLNIAGVFWERSYVPLDFMLLALGEELGFEREEVVAFREHGDAPRRMGNLERVRPREVLIKWRVRK